MRPPRTVSQSGCPALPSPPSLATRVASGLCDGAVVTGSGGSCRGLTCVSLMTRDVDASSRTCRHLRVHVGGLSAQVSSPFQSGYVGFAGVDLEEFLIRRLVCRHPLLSGGWPLRSVNASLAAQSFPFALSRLVCSCFRCLGLWCHIHEMTLPTWCSLERGAWPRCTGRAGGWPCLQRGPRRIRRGSSRWQRLADGFSVEASLSL